MDPTFLLAIGKTLFGGMGAYKTYELQKKQYEMQKKIAEAQKREEAERVKKVSDVANLKEYQENLAEKLGVAAQDLGRIGLRGTRQIADDAATERVTAVDQYGRGRATDPRTTAIQSYEDRLEQDLIGAGGTEAGITGQFSQPSTGGGYAAWGNLYNDAMGEAAGDIEKYAGDRASLMAAMGATRKGDEQTYLMGKDIGLADTGETSMADAFKTDIGTAETSLKEEERRARAKIGQQQAAIDRGYNVGESVYVEPSQTNPYGALSNIFSSANKLYNSWPQQSYSYSGMGQPYTGVSNHPGLR